MQSNPVRRLTASAMLAAVYAALTMGLSFMSYGSVQFRVAEALCVLPFFFPWTVWALAAGCLISNLISAYGPADIVFGTLATLLSGLAAARLGRGDRGSWGCCIAACLMPVLFNAVIVGAVIACAETPVPFSGAFWTAFCWNGLSVGFGELAVMTALGLPLARWLPTSRLYRQLALDSGAQK